MALGRGNFEKMVIEEEIEKKSNQSFSLINSPSEQANRTSKASLGASSSFFDLHFFSFKT